MMNPLVSILIPAYNAEEWIGYTLKSATEQTWPNKEIIVVDDGSKDRTAEIARRFASKNVKVLSKPNGGLSSAVNAAYRECQGEYIQELDSDDMMVPNKIERQLAALREGDSKRLLLSSPWAYFFYRTRTSQFVNTSLCQDLSPLEWLLRKLGENLHMQNATWLVSRELAEAAGPWDESLVYDQDGEYFARVLLASEGTRFVPETGIFYRALGTGRISYIGSSRKKKESLLRSMKFHIQSLRALEDSERVSKACVTYMQNWYVVFYPSQPDLVDELQRMAAELGGRLVPPPFSWKFAWIATIFGRSAAGAVQRGLSEFKFSLARSWDEMMFKWESRQAGAAPGASASPSLAKDKSADTEHP